MLISPLNYAGNKQKLFKELKKYLPNEIDIFVDSFCGSGIIAFNSNANIIKLNDIDKNIIELNKLLYEKEPEEIINKMDKIIRKYNFTDSTKYEYKIFKHEGLSKYNKDPFLQLRNDYNNKNDVELLFALIIFGFNHYLRFNKKGEFNVPVGKVDFSKSLRQKTLEFSRGIKKYNTQFSVGNYTQKNLYENLTEKSLVYFDPPYLITTAPYNINWNEEDDKKLFKFFDELNSKNIKVAMSNVFLSNGKENKNLIEWSKKYNVHYLKRQYRNANYQKKNITDTIEVLITNY